LVGLAEKKGIARLSGFLHMREGLKRRSHKIERKALNYKGFGQRVKGRVKWFSVEYNWESEEDCDLVELHWLKVKDLDPPHRKLIREVIELSGYGKNKLAEEDFLAIIWLAVSMSSDRAPSGCNAAFLFPANTKGDCKIRDAIAGAYGSLDFDEKLLSLCFASVEVDEVVPAAQVSLKNRRLRR
jgi:hypothetical protein